MKNVKVRRMCYIGILTALFVLLNLISIYLGNLRITFASLSTVTGAMLFGPLVGGVSAFLGELVNQIIHYGLGATTVLWLIPPLARGLIIGFIAKLYWKHKTALEDHPIHAYLICIGTAIIVTLLNTVVIWLDSVLLGYFSVAYVFGAFLERLLVGVITAVIVTTVAIPLNRILHKKYGFSH